MENIGVIERFYYEIWNQGRKEVAEEILVPDLRFRGSTGPSKTGISQFLEYVDLIRGALSHYECIINEVVSEGHSSFAAMTFTGRHTGRFFGVAPTNKTVSWNAVALFKFRDGKVADLWVLGDVDNLKQQLGLAQAILP
jgi:predicted ester cyclase